MVKGMEFAILLDYTTSVTLYHVFMQERLNLHGVT
jgi:hypothetical protein